jgi:predicted nucleic-acid-binding protein
VRVTVDTNVLVRAAVADDAAQAEVAAKLLRSATCVAVALPTLCEFVWVLRKVYAIDVGEIAATIRALVDGATVAVDRAAVEAGLALLEAGGDFADGVIAHEGRRLGGEVFASFDRRAVTLLQRTGEAATLLDG